MRAFQPRWILACAAFSALMAQSAWADILTLGAWQTQAKILGDKTYTWMSGSPDLDPEAVVLFTELPEDSSHSLTFLGDLSPYDTYSLAYSVEISSGNLWINSIALSATMSHEGFSITKNVYLSESDLNGQTNSVATLVSMDGAEVGPVGFGLRKKIYVREDIDQRLGGTFTAFSNTIHQTPEPSSWFLASLAAGGAALIVRGKRRAGSPPDTGNRDAAASDAGSEIDV